ncbi:MAG: hypothetical protein RMI91_03830 [Gemmatales bacterium]|nr:hypothetical protein [Gemmatales bacterium]MDW7993762.1 hypothetical protein [Gemmatales bacterium]
MPLVERDSCLHSFKRAQLWEEFWASFLHWEDRLGLFDYLDEGTPLWEYLRVPIFLKCQEALGFFSPTPTLTLAERFFHWHTIRDLAYAIVAANPWLAPSRPVIFWAIARRVYYQGRWWDPYLDLFLGEINDHYLYLERPEGGRRLGSVRRNSQYYTDWFAGASACTRRMIRCFADKTINWLQIIEKSFRQVAKIHVPISELGMSYLIARKVCLWQYRRLLSRLRPRVCIIIALNPAERALVEVCRRLGIVTAELQHGMIGPYDLTYTTPPGVIQKTFPDYLLTFGPYWRKYTPIPTPSENSLDVGFPFLQKIVTDGKRPIREPRILVLGQPGCSRELGQWAIRLAQAAPPGYRVIFRPHPAETLDVNQVQMFESYGIEVPSPQRPLYELLASSEIQVGVFSTALYEGLAFGLKTYIVPLPGYQYMRPLLERGWARLLEDETQPYHEDGSWPRYDLRELFLFEGTKPFLEWLNRMLV